MREIINLKDYRIKLCLKNINDLFLIAKFNRIKIEISTQEIKYILSDIYDLYSENKYIYNFNKETNAYMTDTINNIILNKENICSENLLEGIITCHSLFTPADLPLKEYKNKVKKIEQNLNRR